jgi:phenylalanyl-tRNA synthetase beta chain
MQNVIELIKAIAGGELVGVADVYPAPPTVASVSVSLQKINQILGTNLVSGEVMDVFTRLGFGATEATGVFTVVPPFERLDLTIAEDLVEEVGRMVGYDKVPSVLLPQLAHSVEVNKDFQTAEHVRKELTDLGYSEVVTSVFSEKGERAVLNKVDSVKPYMRATLTDGLNDALKKNIPNKDLLGLKEIKLFEVGTVWKAGHEEMMVGIVTEKPARPDDSGRTGGEKAQEEPLAMHAQKDLTDYEDLPLSTTDRYKTFSKYPYIVRDVAVWVPVGIASADVLQLVINEAGELLVRSSLFDEFTKGEKISYAFRLIFQSFERTLTEVEVNAIMEKIYASLKAKGFEIR